MSADTPQFVTRSSLKIFSGTLISRVTGMLRDIAMAFCFGTSPALAAFLLSYRFVYLLRRLFGEALLHQGFIPHFESVRSQDPKEGALFFRDLFTSMALIVGGVILVGEVALSLVAGQTAHLSMLLLPGVFFICLFGLSSGLLQAEKTFFLPAASPALFNLIWILGVLFLRILPIQQAVGGLALLLSFAHIAQWGMTAPKTWNYLRGHLSLQECMSPRPFSPELKQLVRPLLLGVLGVASVQINSAIDGVFARFASLEGPAYLWYAIRMQQLPLALFALSLSSALLPSLSRAFQEKDDTRFSELLRSAEKRIFTLIFPCMIGIFVLGASSVNLLFGHGDFGTGSVMGTTQCLWAYGCALLPASFVLILAPAFYAKRDYSTPAIAFATSTVINIGLNSLFVFYFHLGASSIALATAFSSFYNLIFLYSRLQRRPRFSGTITKVAIAALLSGLAAYLFDRIFFGDIFDLPRGLARQLIHFGALAGIYFTSFFLLCAREFRSLYLSK